MTNIVNAINAVQAAFAAHGVGKTGRNREQGYSFRTVDAMYEVLNPALRKAGMVMIPQVLSRQEETFTNRKQTLMRHVVLEVQYAFFTEDSQVPFVAKTYGEALDSSDKATNKAFTAAFKYMLIQVFAIPFEGIEDADQETPEVSGRASAGEPQSGDLGDPLPSVPLQEPDVPEATQEQVQTFNKLLKENDAFGLYAFITGNAGIEASLYEQAPKGKKTAMKDAVRTLCSNGAAMAGDYAVQLTQLSEGQDATAVAQLVEELEPEQKKIVWKLLDKDTRDNIRAFME